MGMARGALQLPEQGQVPKSSLLRMTAAVCASFPVFVGILKTFCSAQLPSDVLLETRCVSSARHPAYIFSNRSLGL